MNFITVDEGQKATKYIETILSYWPTCPIYWLRKITKEIKHAFCLNAQFS